MDPTRSQHIRTGATIGVIVGGALGASLGYARHDDKAGGENHRGLSAVVGGVVGALVLGIVGAGVGAVLP